MGSACSTSDYSVGTSSTHSSSYHKRRMADAKAMAIDGATATASSAGIRGSGNRLTQLGLPMRSRIRINVIDAASLSARSASSNSITSAAELVATAPEYTPMASLATAAGEEEERTSEYKQQSHPNYFRGGSSASSAVTNRTASNMSRSNEIDSADNGQGHHHQHHHPYKLDKLDKRFDRYDTETMIKQTTSMITDYGSMLGGGSGFNESSQLLRAPDSIGALTSSQGQVGSGGGGGGDNCGQQSGAWSPTSAASSTTSSSSDTGKSGRSTITVGGLSVRNSSSPSVDSGVGVIGSDRKVGSTRRGAHKAA